MAQSESRANNLGVLRLLLAALVIIFHSPGMVSVNSSRSVLSRVFGPMSLGEVAVDGFFLISGYLVTKSFLHSDSLTSYLEKRILRIYPGFLVSFWLCILLVGPLLGVPFNVLSPKTLFGFFGDSLLLQRPIAAGKVAWELNAPMWTISFEFACYIVALFAGMMGLYSRKMRVVLFAAIVILLVGHSLIPRPLPLIRFIGVFGAGALYYVYRDRVKLNGRGALLSLLALAAFSFSGHWAETGLAVFGGYLLFWVAFSLPVLRFNAMANRVDLSYGLYLYGWPVAMLIAWHFKHINPALLSAVAIVSTIPVAYLSWTFVEKPFLELVRGKGRPSAHVAYPLQAQADPICIPRPERALLTSCVQKKPHAS